MRFLLTFGFDAGEPFFLHLLGETGSVVKPDAAEFMVLFFNDGERVDAVTTLEGGADVVVKGREAGRIVDAFEGFEVEFG